MPILVFVPSKVHQVSFDISKSKPPETWKTLFEDLTLSGIYSYEELPHCVCGLLAYLLGNNVASLVGRVIGVSKRSCFGCMAWFEAVNTALKSNVSLIRLSRITCLTAFGGAFLKVSSISTERNSRSMKHMAGFIPPTCSLGSQVTQRDSKNSESVTIRI